MVVNATYTGHESDTVGIRALGDRLAALGYEVLISPVTVGDAKSRRQVVLATNAPAPGLRRMLRGVGDRSASA